MANIIARTQLSHKQPDGSAKSRPANDNGGHVPSPARGQSHPRLHGQRRPASTFPTCTRRHPQQGTAPGPAQLEGETAHVEPRWQAACSWGCGKANGRTPHPTQGPGPAANAPGPAEPKAAASQPWTHTGAGSQTRKATWHHPARGLQVPHGINEGPQERTRNSAVQVPL